MWCGVGSVRLKLKLTSKQYSCSEYVVLILMHYLKCSLAHFMHQITTETLFPSFIFFIHCFTLYFKILNQHLYTICFVFSVLYCT